METLVSAIQRQMPKERDIEPISMENQESYNRGLEDGQRKAYQFVLSFIGVNETEGRVTDLT